MKQLILLTALLAPTLHAQSFLGFDRNVYPGDKNLAALHKTFSFTGYWLNNPPGATSDTWTGKRAIIEKAGFGFVVLFTGKTYAQLKSNEAKGVGAADGQAAVEAAKREGFPANTIIFLDQEEGGRLLKAQKDYLFAWIDTVSAAGFRAGVYCSGIPATEGSGETVVTADDIRKNAGDRHIVYFVAADSCPPSPGCVYPKTLPEPKDSGVAFADLWQYAQSPRRKDYTQSCAQTYNADGNCYPPDFGQGSGMHVDLDVATEADPSGGRAK